MKPGGQIGIAGAGVLQESPVDPPPHLQGWWEPSLACLHSPEWWDQHWSRSGVVDVELTDAMDDGWRLWLQWQDAVAPGNHSEIQALEADRGQHLGYVRAVARRRPDVELDDPISSIPVVYHRQPLLTNIPRSPGPRTPPPKGTPA